MVLAKAKGYKEKIVQYKHGLKHLLETIDHVSAEYKDHNRKQERSKISGMEQKSKFGSGGPASDSPSKDMFGAEDLALARKRENAKNTIENQ